MARLVPKYYTTKDGKKRLSTYQAEFYNPNRHPPRKRVALRTRDEQDALRKMVMLERDESLGLFDPWNDTIRKDGVLISKAIENFVKSRRREGRKEKTIANYQNILSLFEHTMPPDALVTHIESRHINRFLSGQKLNATSRETYIRHLRAFFKWCQAERIIDKIPLERNKTQRKPKKKVVRFLTREEYERLLSTVESEAVLNGSQPGDIIWLADVIKVAVNTGLRREEICQLRWSDIDFQSGFLTVRESKSGHERSVYLAGDALDAIVKLNGLRINEKDDYVLSGAGGGKLNGNFASQRFRHFRRKAGLPESIHFHSLRHTFASWAVMGGMDLFKLKEILGHSDIKMVMIYAHLRPDAQKEDMQRIFGGSSTSAELEAENTRLKEENEQLRGELEKLKGFRSFEYRLN